MAWTVLTTQAAPSAFKELKSSNSSARSGASHR